MTEKSPISSINRVLKAEAKSRDDIAKCQKQALKIIENGRNQARKISLRADERIGAIHARADLGIASNLAELSQKMTALSGERVIDEKESNRLQSAIEILAQEMVGDSS